MDSNDIISKVEAFIKEKGLLFLEDNLIVGFSGGADSVTLLYILSELKKRREYVPFNLYAYHIHHGIRDKEADRDLDFAKKFCLEREITFFSKKIDIPAIAKERKESIEKVARDERYKAFREKMKEFSLAHIVVAHHKNDLAETIIHNIARGTGQAGLVGMKACNGDIIRPLLCLTREEIEFFVKDKGLDFVTDSSNEDLSYERNYIRKKLIPEFNYLNKQALEHFFRLSNIMDKVNCHLDKEVAVLFKKILEEEKIGKKSDFLRAKDSLFLKKDLLKGYDEIIIDKLYQEIFKYLSKKGELTFERLETLKKTKGAALIELGNQVKVECRKDSLYFYLETESSNNDNFFKEVKIFTEERRASLEKGDLVEINTLTFKMKMQVVEKFIKNDNSALTKFFDYDKINSNVFLRKRSEGDYLIVDKEGRKRKLKKELIDNKLPQFKKDKLFLLAEGSKIIWAIGLRQGADLWIEEKEAFSPKILRIDFEYI